MEKFKNITVGELMEILRQITKQNSEYMQENNQEALEISKSNISKEKIREKKTELYKLNAEYMKENQDFITLYRGLLEFYKMYWNNIEFVQETDSDDEIVLENLGISIEEVKTNQIKKKNGISDLNKKDINKLEVLLKRLIAKEKYEECSIIQKAINEKKAA